MYIFSQTLNFIFNLCIPFLSQIFNLSNQISNFLQTLGKWLLFLILLMEPSYRFWLSLLSIGLVPCLKLLFKKNSFLHLPILSPTKETMLHPHGLVQVVQGDKELMDFQEKKGKLKSIFTMQYNLDVQYSPISILCAMRLYPTPSKICMWLSLLCAMQPSTGRCDCCS